MTRKKQKNIYTLAVSIPVAIMILATVFYINFHKNISGDLNVSGFTLAGYSSKNRPTFLLKSLTATKIELTSPTKIFIPEVPFKNLGNEKIKLAKKYYLSSNHIHKYPSFDTGLVNDIIAGRKVNTLGDKYVFLTFDDGINQVSTPAILDVLQLLDVPGTFMLLGQSANEYNANVLHRIINDGHAIAIHSYDHNYNSLYPNRIADIREIKNQALNSLKALKSILGENFSTSVWRYPGGHMSWYNIDKADEELSSIGFEWIDWNSMAGLADISENRPKNTAEVLDYIKKSMRYSSTDEVYVVLMHDTPDKMLIPISLQEIISFFKNQGYKFALLH